jgi:hypothetical protein
MTGNCNTSGEDTACGSGGEACTDCTGTGQTCQSGACGSPEPSSSGGSPSGSSSGSGAGGTSSGGSSGGQQLCILNICIPIGPVTPPTPPMRDGGLLSPFPQLDAGHRGRDGG